MVVLDSCRADKLGCYGFDRPTAPAIDRLAADPDGIVFERHYVQAGWTKPSTASLFTGRFVHQHKVGSQGAIGAASLPDDLTTLAEEFSRAGYFSFGLSSIPHTAPRYGFGRGFQVYELAPPGDDELYRRALEIAHRAGRPFFGYVHLLACHQPYPPLARDPEYMTRFGFGFDEAAGIARGVDFTKPRLRAEVNEGRLELRAEEVRFLHLIYESVLRRFDRDVFGPFLEELRARGLFENTLLVVTADHGEELYEHRGLAHGHALWDEVIRVPLIVKFPKGRRPSGVGSRWEGVTQAVDLYPSLLAAVGLSSPGDLPGRDLFGEPSEGFALAGSLMGELALIRGNEKVVGIDGLANDVKLFDLKADPRERIDLASERPESVRSAREAVRRLAEAYPPGTLADGAAELENESPVELEVLRALGYVD